MSERTVVALSATALAGLVGFVAVMSFVLASGGQSTTLDTTVLQWFVSVRSPLVTALAQAVTVLGSVPVVITVALLVAGLLAWRTRGWTASASLGVAVGVTAGAVFLLKLAVGRARPPLQTLIGTPSTDYSFPSGHTTDGSVVWVLAACLVAATTTRKAYRRLLIAVGIAVALAVGLTRLYLGYHWFTDVLAGWCLAVAVVAGVLTSAAVLSRQAVPEPPTADRSLLLARSR